MLTLLKENMAAFTSTFLTIVEFILAFGILIFLHEFGHFLIARLSHIEVEEFGFGYPPRICKLFRLFGTDFTLNWIPFGGFCRMKGENGDVDEPGSFMAAPAWRRFFTLLGGPLMNLLLGMILIVVIILRTGAADPTRVMISTVDANSPAALVNMQPGDFITEVNGKQVTSLDSMSALIQNSLGKDTEITLVRGSETLKVDLVPRANPPKGQGAMGITITNPVVPVTFFQAIPSAFLTTVDQGVQLVMIPVKLISGQISSDNARMVSVVGLYSIFNQVKTEDAQQAAAAPQDAGLTILSYLAILSIALGYTNLLPIPALDGGRILFVLPELLFKKRVPPELENRVHMVGYSLLMILMFVLIINDIINPVTLP